MAQGYVVDEQEADAVQGKDSLEYLEYLRRHFDEPFYVEQLESLDGLPSNLIFHYLNLGAQRRLSPTPFFDPIYYLEQQPDAEDEADLLFHYMSHGMAAGLKPHRLLEPGVELDDASINAMNAAAIPAPGRECLRDYCGRIVRASAIELPATRYAGQSAADLVALFDLPYYSEQLIGAGLDVPAFRRMTHYMEDGWRLGLDPNPLFRSTFYLDINEDVALSGVNPLLHYVLFGWREQRLMHPLFHGADTIWANKRNPLVVYFQLPASERPVLSPAFSSRFYQAMHSQIDWAVEDPLVHYLRTGWKEGAMPHPAFDPVFYKASLMGAAAERMSPLEHYAMQPAPHPKNIRVVRQ
jgi:hypothetical protein